MNVTNKKLLETKMGKTNIRSCVILSDISTLGVDK